MSGMLALKEDYALPDGGKVNTEKEGDFAEKSFSCWVCDKAKVDDARRSGRS